MRYALIVLVALLSVGCGGRSIRKAIEAEAQHIEAVGHDHTHSNSKQGIKLSAERLDTKQAVDTVYMGRVSAGEIVTKKIAVCNEEEGPMVMLGSRTTCGCVGVEFSSEPVQGKRTRDIEVRFDSAGYGGKFSQSLYLTTSLSEEPLHLVVTADVR